MRYLFLIFLSVLFTTTLAQRHKKVYHYRPPSALEIMKDEIAEECFFANKYSKAQRLNFYPFNKAAAIKLISFKEEQRIPVKNKIIDEQQVLEQVILSAAQTDSLTNLLYNITFTPVKVTRHLFPGSSCYMPRNGILFMDAKGMAFEYIEICFACERIETSSAHVNEGDDCLTKYDLLRNFFSAAGIKYGTGDREPVQPYQEIFKLDTMDAVFAIQNKLVKKMGDKKDLNLLNETERTLFLTINSDKVYDGRGLSGLAQFYFDNSGNFYPQTLASLKVIGAQRTLKAFEESKIQWPKRQIPESLLKRRAVLLRIVNTANPQWKKIEKGLIDEHDIIGGAELIPKEGLIGMIFKFATLHRDELVD